MEITLIYVPFPDKIAAEQAIKSLLETKLIACGNVISSESMYFWQGAMTKENEWIAIIKTTNAVLDNAILKIKALHSYDVPAILHWQVQANDTYANWVMEQVKG